MTQVIKQFVPPDIVAESLFLNSFATDSKQ